MNINPSYALLALEWEPTEALPQDLSSWRNSLHLDTAEVLFLYGLGDGTVYHQFVPWLKENPERRLVILEENTGHIATALQTQCAFLSDSQVSLEWLDVVEPLFQALAERYPIEPVEIVALPGKEGAKFRRLRLQLLRKISLTYSLFIDRIYGVHHFKNFVKNLPQLKNGFYANGLQGVFAEMPAIICGAGPSLQQAIEQLKQLNGRAIIIAGGSAIAALTSAGVEPHFAMAIDPNEEEFHRMKNSFAFEIPFLFSTRVCSSVFQTCNGPFGYMRSGVGGMSELWLEEELGLTGPLLGQHLSDESISVTAIALSFAQHIGCKTILLCGMDLAYTGGHRYSPGVMPNAVENKAVVSASACDRILRRKDKQGKFVKTAVRWVMEAASISHYAKKHPEIRWINTTEGGLPIRGVEQMSFAEASIFTKHWDLKGLIAQQIALNPLPKTEKDLISDLKGSLSRVIVHLEVLAGVRRGAKALADIELREELAYSILFYDMEKVLSQALSRKSNQSKWTQFLEIANIYYSVD